MSEKRRGKTFIFKSFSECVYYHQIYGGRIIPLTSHELQTVIKEEDPYDEDYGLNLEPRESLEYVEVGPKYYLLHVTNKATLLNGFRYIKADLTR
jgi:hypothetical protein